MSEPEVRVYVGVPPARVFAATSGTPIVINTATDTAYYLKTPGDIPTPLTGGGGGGGTTIIVKEVDGSPSGSIDTLVLPNTTLGIVGTVATYTPGPATLLYWAESRDAAGINAVVPIHRWYTFGSESDIDIALSPKGQGGMAGDLADGTTTGGNKRGAYAVDWQRTRNAATQVASGASAVIGGGATNTASGNNSVVAGGIGNSATFTNSAVCGGSSNVSSSGWDYVGGGSANVASGGYSVVGGGQNNQATQSWATIPGGLGNLASGLYSYACNANTTASGQFTFAAGYLSEANSDYASARGRRSYTNGMVGCDAFSSFYDTNPGDRQRREALLQASTSGAVTVAATVGSGAAAATNQFNLLSGTCSMTVHGVMHVYEPSTGNAGSRTVQATFNNAAGTVAVLGSSIGAFVGSAAINAATWSAVADSGNGCGRINAIGIAAKGLKFNFQLFEITIR